MEQFDTSYKECTIIAPLLLPQACGAKWRDDPEILNTIFYIQLTGAP